MIKTNKKKMGNLQTKKNYHLISTNETDILMNDIDDDSKKYLKNEEKAFDFAPLNDYRSIFTYNNRTLKRHDPFEIETKTLQGPEKYINFFIIAFFYLLMICLLPFSLIICLKKVKENERIVAYRLGRIISPEIKPGFCILFPLIDSYQRFNIFQKEFSIINLQILNYENSIIDTSIQIRYIINDVIKMSSTIQDINNSLKSISRSLLINSLSKKETHKLENEIFYLKQDFKNELNNLVRKWGVQIVEAEITINSIIKDENEGEDPALKTIKSVFMSLFNRDDSDSSKPKTSNSQTPGQLPTEILNMFQGMMPTLIPNSSLSQNLANNASNSNDENQSENFPFKLLRLLQPLLNESLIRDIQTVYEFHIRYKGANQYEEDKYEVFFLDLKSLPTGNMGAGPCMFAKVDCIIKLSEEDLKDLLTDTLKPFTAYMSGRIEIEGDLQDVLKLKKLIKNVTAAIGTSKII